MNENRKIDMIKLGNPDSTRLKLETLDDCREKIDGLDRQVLEKLAERLSLMDRIVELKNNQDLPIEDSVREEELMKKYEQWAEELGLDAELVKAIFSLIIEKSKELQREL